MKDAWSWITRWISLSERKQELRMATGASWRWFISEATTDLSLIWIVSVQCEHCAAAAGWKPSLPVCSCAHTQWWTVQARMNLQLKSPPTVHSCSYSSQTSRLGISCLFVFFSSMSPKWSRPESFWQSKWQDDRPGRQSKGRERFLWTASCYLIFLCRIIILRLFAP